MARENGVEVTEQHWNEFLEKLDFAQLTSRWNLLPLHWLDDQPPAGLDADQAALYEGLLSLPKELDPAEREAKVEELVDLFRQSRSARSISLEPSLTPPGSRVILRYLDPERLGQGDCLITVGSWDRLGHFIAEQAGLEDVPGEPSENPVRREPGKLGYRHLLIFPDKGSPTPRSFRALCEKTLRQARGLGARRLTITHLHLPQPGLPDRFAAAELFSAVRAMIRDGGGISVEIMVLTKATFEDYRHWFESLADLSRGQSAGEESPPPGRPEPVESEPEAPGEPVLANALRDFAQRTSSLAQEAGRGVSSWLRAATAPSPPAAAPPARWPGATLEPTFEDQQALNLLYLGRWKEAELYRHRWEEDSLLGLYLAALHKVVSYIDLNPVVVAPEVETVETVETVEELVEEPSVEPVAVKKKGRGKKKAAPAEEPSEEPEETVAADGPTPEIQSEEAPPEDLPGESEAAPPLASPEDLEYQRLRGQLLDTASDLGVENPLARYFQLLAWRLDERRSDTDPDQFEEDHARLLRAAWAWEDQALLGFLRAARQDQENPQSKASLPGYVPVFPSGSRPAPRLD